MRSAKPGGPGRYKAPCCGSSSATALAVHWLPPSDWLLETVNNKIAKNVTPQTTGQNTHGLKITKNIYIYRDCNVTPQITQI